MAMNLLNPIQLLRGTSAAIASAQSQDGTLYFDTQRGNLIAKSTTGDYTFPRLASETTTYPTIYVDAVNGNDDNYGYDESNPIKTLEKAFWLCNARITAYPVVIYI